MHDKNIKNWLCKFTAIYQTVYLRGAHFMVFKLYFNEAIFLKSKMNIWYMEKA